MSLRNDLETQIRFEISEDPTGQAALLAGGDIDTDVVRAFGVLNAYCNALKSALLNLADEVDALRSG